MDTDEHPAVLDVAAAALPLTGYPTPLVLLRSFRRRHPVLNELRASLRRVELSDLDERWESGWASAVVRVRLLARLLVLLSVLLFPFPQACCCFLCCPSRGRPRAERSG